MKIKIEELKTKDGEKWGQKEREENIEIFIKNVREVTMIVIYLFRNNWFAHLKIAYCVR